MSCRRLTTVSYFLSCETGYCKGGGDDELVEIGKSDQFVRLSKLAGRLAVLNAVDADDTQRVRMACTIDSGPTT